MSETQSIPDALTDQNRDRPSSSVLLTDTACDSCGYNLRGLSATSHCPECGTPVAKSLTGQTSHGRADRRWAMLVLAGLVMLLLIFPTQVWVLLQMKYTGVAFGAAPRLNLPSPKAWAVPLIQRSVGFRVEDLGLQGAYLTLAGVLAIFLITTPRHTLVERSPISKTFRWLARWLPPFLIGGFFGFLLNQEGLFDNRGDINRYTFIAVLFVEVPCTALLFGSLILIAGELHLSAARQRMIIAAVAGVLLQIAAVVMMYIAPSLNQIREGLIIQSMSSAYEAACVIVGLMMITAMLKMTYELGAIALPTRLKRWWDATKSA